MKIIIGLLLLITLFSCSFNPNYKERFKENNEKFKFEKNCKYLVEEYSVKYSESFKSLIEIEIIDIVNNSVKIHEIETNIDQWYTIENFNVIFKIKERLER